jgi:hypothetical protein
VKAALAQGANPMLVPGGGPRRVVLNNVLGKYKGIGTLEDNYVHMTETWIPNPVVGDMRITHEYVEWKDFGGFKFWTEDHSHMIDTNQNDNRQFRVSSARANIAVAPQTFAVPQEVTQANRPAVRVESTLAPGVWLLGGGSRNSVLVEFRDFVTVVEAPLNGLRGLIAAGANQVVTSEDNAEYYSRIMFGLPRRLMPDSLSQRDELLGTFVRPQYVRVANQPAMTGSHAATSSS